MSEGQEGDRKAMSEGQEGDRKAMSARAKSPAAATRPER